MDAVRARVNRSPWAGITPMLNRDRKCFLYSCIPVFCRYCVLFVERSKGDKYESFVIKPFTNYARLFGSQGAISNHTATDYHRCSIVKAEEFLKRSKDRSMRIENTLNSNRVQQIKDNRDRHKPILKSILFCGRNGLALRGHRDNGDLTLDQPTYNDGNFRALLRFRADSGDMVVSEKIFTRTAPKNARYLHYEIQNEIIHICGDQILEVLLKKINDSCYFSVLADETTDISGIEQMNICMR